MDNIIVVGASQEDHHLHLQQWFKRHSQHGLILNSDKCLFGVTKR
jgi:hypothetical protein